MWRIVSTLAFLIALALPASAQSRIDQLTGAAAISSTDKIPLCQGCGAGTPAVAATGTQLGTFIGANAVTSIATGCGATGGTITSTGTIAATEPVNSQTGANYAFANSDCGKLVSLSNGSAQTPTIAQAGSGGNFAAGWFVDVTNTGAGTQTITPTTSTINGNATCALITNQSVRIVSDGANYQVTGGDCANVIGPASAISGHLATFNGTSGKLLQDGGAVPVGTVTSVTCPSGGAITTSGTCQVDVQTFCPSGCTTTVAGGGSGTWTRPSSVTEVAAFGCGGGGQGGGGATTVSGTASSGGAGGGGADCHWKTFKAADAGSSQTVTLGAGGSTGGQGSSTAGGAAGTAGQSGGSTTFGALETWFGGGGGAGGVNSATVSIGGAGGSPFAAGGVGTITGAKGCTNTNNSNGGGSGTVSNTQPGLCGAGGGGSGTNGSAGGGGIALMSAPGGESGGGVTTTPGGVSAAASNGGASSGCQAPPAGGAVGASGAASVNPDFPYHSGCGGAGGGGQLGNTGAPGGGTAGTAGAGGGGGGSVCSSGGACTAQNGGQGGNGGAGFMLIISR